MSQLKSCVADVMDRIRRRHDADPGEFWHACLFWTFWVSLALFPIGYGWREVTPPLCFIFLLLYYRHAWHRSVLRRLTVWPLFLCAGAMTLIGVVFSTDVWKSFLHGGMGVNKAYILPFIAMECVRSTRDLRRLVHACVLACVWQGLDGMWQAWTGFDFIMGYPPNAGRLTGSLGDYSVGNYMALAMIPAFACWFLLRRRLGVLPAAIVWVVLFIPAFFLLEGASSRSGLRLRVLGPAGGRQDGTHRPLGLRPSAGGLHPAVLPPHGSVHHRGGRALEPLVPGLAGLPRASLAGGGA